MRSFTSKLVVITTDKSFFLKKFSLVWDKSLATLHTKAIFIGEKRV